MATPSFPSRLRAAFQAALRYPRASPADAAAIGDVLAQAAAYERLAKYRASLGQARPAAPAAGAPSRRVWQLWWQGVETAPPIVRTCLESVSRHLPQHEVVLLDSGKIADHVEVPGHLHDRLRRGEMSLVHFTDLVRVMLLAEHGGTWMDATVYLTAPPVEFLDLPLFCFSVTPPDLLGAGRVLASSWYIRAERAHPLPVAVRDLLVEFWRHEAHSPHVYYFHLAFALAVAESEACAQAWRAVPFYSNVPPHVLQRELFQDFDAARFEAIKRMTPVHKLTHYGGPEFQPGRPGTFYAHLTGARA
jgi:hypothetical protein